MLRDMEAPGGLEYELLAAERDRAERQLNGVRAIVLTLLACAAVLYASTLSRPLNMVNAAILVPMLAWTVLQFVLFYRQERLPSWLAIVNPIVDIVAVTLAMGGYGLEATPPLALKSPMVLAYFVILAGRPIASSVRKAVVVALLVLVAYVSLDTVLLLRQDVLFSDPVLASTGQGISLLDEGAKITFLAVAGGIATYATWWHEQLMRQYSMEARERELLQERLAMSKLDSLKQQLQPHFLFNALNAMAALVETDPPAAQRMISGLGDLIRLSLESGGDQEVSLRQELAVLDHYIAIQRMRFEDRLVIVTDVEEQVRDALVPALILQPLVENAIKYGLSRHAGPGRIEVRAWRDGDSLALAVIDDGPGLQGKAVESLVERVGVGNARARLMYLYGEQHTFTIDSPATGGFTVHMRLPYRTSAGRRTTDGSAA
jgi:two-component system LytT family sensor kinase